MAEKAWTERDTLLLYYTEETLDDPMIKVEECLRLLYKAITKLRVLDAIEKIRWPYMKAFGAPGNFHFGENYILPDKKTENVVFGYYAFVEEQRNEVLVEIDRFLKELGEGHSTSLQHFIMNLKHLSNRVEYKSSSVTTTGGDKNGEKSTEARISETD